MKIVLAVVALTALAGVIYVGICIWLAEDQDGWRP